MIQGAKFKGAERIIAIDQFDSKLKLAEEFGATDLVNAKDTDAVAAVQELTGGRGVDVSFEVIGLKATVQQALAMARRGGQAIIVGVPKMEQMMEIPIAMELLVNEKQVRGSWYGSSNVQRDVPMLIDLYKEGHAEARRARVAHDRPGRHQRRVQGDGSRRSRPLGRRLRNLTGTSS